MGRGGAGWYPASCLLLGTRCKLAICPTLIPIQQLFSRPSPFTLTHPATHPLSTHSPPPSHGQAELEKKRAARAAAQGGRWLD